ncbi:MAG: ATP-binding cassette domain-containing protein, partial [Bacillota bacterium]
MSQTAVSNEIPQLLRMEGIDKSFPGVHALDTCRFDLRAGEVHALVGENGAGKSTLMKVLTGIYQKDAGEIYIDGKLAEIHHTRDAQQLGISIIHQELNLMLDLTVAENIFIGREALRGWVLDKKKQNQMTRDLLRSLSMDIDPATPIKYLTVAKQQMVEIAKALSYQNTRILIMDEPSAA